MKLIINTDGGARGNPGPAAAAFVIKNENDQVVHQQAFYLGETTNNVAEYSAVVKALEYLSQSYQNQELHFLLDSNLVVQQLNKNFKIKDVNLKTFAEKVFQLLPNFLSVSFSYVPRAENYQADALVNKCLDEN